MNDEEKEFFGQTHLLVSGEANTMGDPSGLLQRTIQGFDQLTGAKSVLRKVEFLKEHAELLHAAGHDQVQAGR